MLINAGYFRAHMYTCVPSQIRDDFRRMRASGTTAVTVSVLEQDLFAAVENLRIIAATARDEGLLLYADIARWGGLVSGTPKVPSLFASMRPDLWKRHADGRPVSSFGYCPVLSIFQPETRDFFVDQLRQMFALIPFAGVFWNEPKAIHTIDHGEAARRWFAERGLDHASLDEHVRAHVDFFGSLNAEIRRLAPAAEIACFTTPGSASQIDMFASMPELDTFGCDGRAWSAADETEPLSYKGKCLPQLAPAFLAAARRHGRKTFAFVENIDVPDAYLPMLDRRLPELLAMDIDHLLYYYYGRSVASPDRCMDIMFRHLAAKAAR